MKNFLKKVKRRIRKEIVKTFKCTKVYKYLYVSYWHSIFYKNKNRDISNHYFSAVPNPGAGIGHQMANWIAGYHFAQFFGLKFAHIPFASDKWEEFLGFYQNEVTVKELLKEGYKLVRLPFFDENNENQIAVIKKIISSYGRKKVVFLAEQDQFYKAQYPISEVLKHKFYGAPARSRDNIIYNSHEFNIAIHVRRGDIVQKDGENNPNLTMRYQSNDYFVNALDFALNYLNDKKNIKIYLFSQGKPEDYSEFSKYNNIQFCLEMSAQESFLHMVYADALITSKSSFSYKPALLNNGIKFCPQNFWHGYPQNENWILLDDHDLSLDNNIL